MKLYQRLLLILLLLTIPSQCFAVYEYNVSVNKTGEDYNTVTLAEDALDNAGDIRDSGTVKCGAWDNCTAGTCNSTNLTDGEAVTWDSGSSSGTLHHLTSTEYIITATVGTLDDNDLVTDGTNTFQINGAGDSCQITIDVYNDDGVLTDTPGVNGFTTDVDNFVKITAPSGERHNGTEFSGATISSNSGNIVPADNYTEISWLVFTSSTNNGTNYEAFIKPIAGANNSVVKNNVFYDINNISTGTFGAAIGSSTQSYTNFFVYDNIIYNTELTGVSWGFGNQGVLVYNNTIYNAGSTGFAIGHTNSTVTAKNNLICASVTADYGANIDTRVTNASCDATGDGSLINFTASNQFTNTSSGSEDFHLKSGANAIDVGTDLTTSANIDIDGRDRDATGDVWDLGADEFVASAAVASKTTINSANLNSATVN